MIMKRGTHERLPWVDYAKGLSILLVVHMHASLGVEKALGEAGVMVAVAEFASTFRMPLFFMVAGLFIMRSARLSWRDYLDRRVLHLVYFFVLWTLVTVVFKGLPAVDWQLWRLPAYIGLAMVEPLGTLWFIYVLALFYLATRFFRDVALPILWGFAAALHVITLHSGWTVIDAFAENYIFFVTGHAFAPVLMRSVAHYQEKPLTVVPVTLLALAANGALISLGLADFPGVTLAAGLFLPYTLILCMGLLARHAPMPWLGYCGKQSIVIYLAFFIPMVLTREALLRFGIVLDVDAVSLIVWLAAALSPLLVHRILKGTPLDFFFTRPEWAHLGRKRGMQVPAE